MALDNTTQLPDAVLQELVHAIGRLRYGSVEITVHEGRVTQIECREKLRFKPLTAAETRQS